MADELESLVEAAEADVRAVVTRALDETRREYFAALARADELTAAMFSVASISGMWKARVPRILTELTRIFRRSARNVAQTAEAPLPDNWEEAPLAQYVNATRPLLNAVGDHLAEAAVVAMTEGLNNGEDVDQIRARLMVLFSASGSEMGPYRANLIATTEATRAWNTAALAAAQAVTGPDRPLVKQWRTRGDDRVRAAHRDVDGQLQLLADAFTVDGNAMQYPGDPSAPPSLTVGCRCVLAVAAARRTEGETVSASAGDELVSKMPPQLKAYWLTGEGAAKIGWGTPGDFERCVRELRDNFPQDPEGLCANLHHEATGEWPGRESAVASSQDYSDSGMIALIPSREDAARLALDGGEDADQLHCTLMFLGDITEWTDDDVTRLVTETYERVTGHWPVKAKLFGVNQWNPDSDSPAWVWATGDQPESEGPSLTELRTQAELALDYTGLLNVVPTQHTPWVAHVTGAYDTSDQHRDAMVARCGPVTFDRVRVAIGGRHYDIPLMGVEPEETPVEDDEPMTEPYPAPSTVEWSTPGSAALAFENQETGDGRVFAPGALYWGSGPWPLQYADEMLDGHAGAALAGAIQHLERDGDRIPGRGCLYLDTRAGWESYCLLAQGAPLGVSVDLDDVTMEFVDRSGSEPLVASLNRVSVTPLADGGWALSGETDTDWTASGTTMAGASTRVQFVAGANGSVSRGAVLAVFGADPGVGRLLDLEAAAGDTAEGGTVMETASPGDMTMRITRARVRGATLVAIPAYADARIALDEGVADPYVLASADATAALAGDAQWEVVQCVRSSLTPLTAAEVASRVKLPVQAVRDHLAKATEKGTLVRIARGLYVGPVEEVTAAVSGAVDLPVAGRETPWDGDAAERRVFEWADGDAEKVGQAFLWRDPDTDGATQAAWKLGYADVVDGTLTIVPAGVFAAAGALQGARGGVDIPEADINDVKARVEALYARLRDELGDDGLHAPWEREEHAMSELEASAWTALAELPPMPAQWFSDPTELLAAEGAAGVNYSNGRIYGWVARAGEPHAGFAQKVTIESLGAIGTEHFLRQRFQLDDGSTVKAGAFTMNVGHHRDGAECETSACQFDDTRTVAGIVTVGMAPGGMWFSGAAAPWLSEWDRAVFAATQPSYHMKKGPNGKWQLRAVLSVPVPGHSSPLLASAVAERANLALVASVALVQPEPVVDEPVVDEIGALAASVDYDKLADAMVAAVARAETRRQEEAAELDRLRAEAMAEMAKLEITASAAEGEGN